MRAWLVQPAFTLAHTLAMRRIAVLSVGPALPVAPNQFEESSPICWARTNSIGEETGGQGAKEINATASGPPIEARGTKEGG